MSQSWKSIIFGIKLTSIWSVGNIGTKSMITLKLQYKVRWPIWFPGCDTEFWKDIHHCSSTFTILQCLLITFNIRGASIDAVHSFSKNSTALVGEQSFTCSLIVSSLMVWPYTGYSTIKSTNLISFLTPKKHLNIAVSS